MFQNDAACVEGEGHVALPCLLVISSVCLDFRIHFNSVHLLNISQMLLITFPAYVQFRVNTEGKLVFGSITLNVYPDLLIKIAVSGVLVIKVLKCHLSYIKVGCNHLWPSEL